MRRSCATGRASTTRSSTRFAATGSSGFASTGHSASSPTTSPSPRGGATRSRCSSIGSPSGRESSGASPTRWRSPSAKGAASPSSARDSPAAAVREVVLEGSGDQEVEIVRQRHGRRDVVRRPFPGIVALLERRARQTHSSWLREELEGLVTDRPCAACEGTRLRRETRFVRVGGRNIVEVAALPIGDAAAFFRCLALSPAESEIARPILKQVSARLGFLIDVGLDYLTLDRGAATLSGGEGQRIRLATQIGSRLVGVLYILH